MKKTLLSILIPNYNHSVYLPECLSSVLQSTSKNLEIVIVDDASTDNSIQIIESFLKKDTRIKLIKNKTNKGVNRTLNDSLKKISGEYVFGLSADDKILPGFFALVFPILQNHPEIDLCSSDYAYFHDQKNDQIRINRLLETTEPYLILPPQKTIELLKKTEFWIPGNASIIRTSLALEYGGYREELKHYSDFYLFHKIALTRTIGYIPKGISAMRIVPGSYSASCLSNKALRKESQYNLLNLILKDDSCNLFAKSTILRALIKDNFFISVFIPKYWKFLFPLIYKKIRKILMRKSSSWA